MGLKKINIDWEFIIGDWYDRKEIKTFLSSIYMNKLLSHLLLTYKNKKIYPNRDNIFKCFKLTKPKNLKVVILGQDPYFDGTAIGLAFGNKINSSRLSPSLSKILERIEKDFNTLKIDEDITLSTWAEQGVLLLNTALTVEHGMPNSHKKPWEAFTKFIIKHIAQSFPGTIFMMWGKQAQEYEVIDGYDLNKTCYVLKAEHPSYAARQNRVWNCNNFLEANKIIKVSNGKEFCIEW